MLTMYSFYHRQYDGKHVVMSVTCMYVCMSETFGVTFGGTLAFVIKTSTYYTFLKTLGPWQYNKTIFMLF